MKRVLCCASVLVLICTSYTFGQDVAVFYDAAVENGNGLAVPNPKQLAEMIVDELDKKKLTAEIVDSDELAEYMEANPQGIYIITQGNTPGTIFKKEGKKDLVYTWLRGGGIGGFIGDYVFYYYWDKRGACYRYRGWTTKCVRCHGYKRHGLASQPDRSWEEVYPFSQKMEFKSRIRSRCFKGERF